VSPLLLALDTTHECGSISLARGAEIVEEVRLHAPDGFAHVIYPYLAALLARHSVFVDEIECFASAAGPGSFTGVRVGLACVKGLAEACSKPAVAVSNLEALASCGSAALRAAVLDARRGEVYGAVYDAAGRLVEAETVGPLAAWLKSLPRERDLEFISPDHGFLRSGLLDTPFERFSIVTAPPALSAAVARIAFARLVRGEALNAAALDANYVRRSDAELFWKE